MTLKYYGQTKFIVFNWLLVDKFQATPLHLGILRHRNGVMGQLGAAVAQSCELA